MSATTKAPAEILFPNRQVKTFMLAGKQAIMETGHIARAAQGSVTLQVGETVVMVTACGGKDPRPGIDFFPLLCDFEEKMFTVGRLPGGYLKREGRPSEKAVLTCRLMDRPIRPLWPDGYRNDVQVVATPLSIDNVEQVDVLSVFAASMALELAGLPFQGPLGAVRVGRINGQFILNPTHQQSDESDLDLVVAGTEASIMMVEAGAGFITEADLLDAIALAHDEIKRQVQVQKEFCQQAGVVKTAFVPDVDLEPLKKFVAEQVEADVFKAYHIFDSREGRQEILADAKKRLKETIAAQPDDHPIKSFLAAHQLDYLSEAFKKVEKRVMRTMIMDEGLRADGRKSTEIRPIVAEVGILPRVHGSALFTRGGTQVLSIATLGSPGDAQRLDGVDPATEKRWMHHYSFPPYSVGEVRPLRGAGRREIGHGALAERAVGASLPTKEEFAYTIRVNSEAVESNGSTSMASTCGASLALMDAGVPVKTMIGGIAMGLIKEGDRYVVLSDIQGVEDFLGDMDFKVTGNRDGVTALQMDIKIQGISLQIMREALEQARLGRLHIMDCMSLALAAPRPQLSPWAPRLLQLKIDVDQIGGVIGPGGKTIRGIIEKTGASIDIEDDGTVIVASVDGAGAEEAKRIIEQLTLKVQPGQIYMGKVVRIIPVGAFVELVPGKDGMVHVSQIAFHRVGKPEDALNVGDQVLVKVVEIDDRGRVNLTIKGVSDEERAAHGLEPLPRPTPEEMEAQRAQFANAGGGGERRGPRPGGGGFGGGGRGPRPGGDRY